MATTLGPAANQPSARRMLAEGIGAKRVASRDAAWLMEGAEIRMGW